MEKYKNEIGLSYREIAIEADIDKPRAFHAVNNPWRVSKAIFLRVAAVIGCPEEDAVKIYNDSKLERFKKRLEER